MNRLSMVFNTCDAYMDLSDNFFILLKKYWPEFDCEIFFNTDTKNYQNSIYRIVNVSHKNTDNSWSQRLYDALKLVKTDYVILFLEDFYIEGKVNNKEVLKCLDYMDSHKKVNSIIFTKEPGCKNKLILELGNFCYRNYFTKYKITAHAGIYRTSFLKKVLKKTENAWQFEVNGSVRSFFLGGKFICKSDKDFTVPYHYGLLVTRGKYNKELKLYFEEKENLVFEKERDVYSMNDPAESTKNGIIKKIKYPVQGVLSIFKRKPE